MGVAANERLRGKKKALPQEQPPTAVTEEAAADKQAVECRSQACLHAPRTAWVRTVDPRIVHQLVADGAEIAAAQEQSEAFLAPPYQQDQRV
jgi:hypothetical protein